MTELPRHPSFVHFKKHFFIGFEKSVWKCITYLSVLPVNLFILGTAIPVVRAAGRLRTGEELDLVIFILRL